ncbi:Hypothetical predicted protein [Cloeon dipterum]|uniref:[histone H3]-dimethyl-L-lysine(36) demethylase n=1 Tax=Cloeon dipterum TaxID=197152 RepID=A0A8S1BVS9_9INSE|nr:Hypothetical predicted protein [Cloeon dipterum]
MLDVMDVNTQKNMDMTMKEWQKYYESPNKERLLNVISLEFSHTKLESYVQAPTVVRQLDWVDCVWPKYLKDMQIESTNVLEDMMYPKVQKYCLMSVKNCYTDFHVDFGGTSVWYHIIKGNKVFWLIPPSEHNISLYEQWVLSGKQSDIFFGDTVEKCCRVHLEKGNTFFIPSGWIHAVFTPSDTLVFGGNFLHSYGIEKQLRIAKLEDTTKVPQKFRYPFFTEMLWYVLEKYVFCLLGNSHLNLPPEASNARLNYHPQHDVHLTAQELHGLKDIVLFLHNLPPHKKNVPELIPDAIKLINDVRSLVQQHHRNPLSRSSSNSRGVPRVKGHQGSRGSLGGNSSRTSLPSMPSQQHSPLSASHIQTPNRPPDTPKPVSSGSGSGSNNNGPRRRRTRCKKCEACNRADCGECNFCLDMVKFGGPGRAKQTCVMRQCLQPMLPVTAACAVCRLDGWGLEPVVPIQKTAERASVPSSLMECSVCFEIMHPKCAVSRLPPGIQATGQVNEDMPNSWECPLCCKEGKNQDYKPRHFRARNKTSGGPLPEHFRRGSFSSESSENPARNIKTEFDSDADPMSPSGSSKAKPEPPHLSPDRRRRYSMDSEVVDDAGPPVLDGEAAPAVHRPVNIIRPPLRSQLAAQLIGSSTKQLKRPTVVVRPSGIPPDTKTTVRLPGGNLAMDKEVMSLVFRFLNQQELNTCTLVCKSWMVWACSPKLWTRMSLAHSKVTAAVIQGVVKRQPSVLILDWSTVSSKQLGWLLPRLPQLHSLSLQGCTYATCVVALRTSSCPMLTSLDLSYVTGMNDCCLREILSPPPDSRPGLTDNKSRLRNLRDLVLVGCDISDVSVRYIVQYLKSIEALSLGLCYKITDAGVAQLSSNNAPTLTNLKYLNLSGCKMITDLSLEHLERCKGLQRLDCRHTPLITAEAMRLTCQRRPNLVSVTDKLLVAKD